MSVLGSYFKFVKIEHTLFSLPVIYAGATLANYGWPKTKTSILILITACSARICAMGLNRIIDRKIDALNPRTSSRELPKNILTMKEALGITFLGGLIYVTGASALSDFCLAWSWLPLVLFAIYPTLKRFTTFAHFGLGLAWAAAPLGGWFAVSPGFAGSVPAFIMAFFSFFWLSGFDIIYACLDEEFDRNYGLHSLPAKLGRVKALRVSGALHVAAFACILLLYAMQLKGIFSGIVLMVCGILLYLEHKLANNVNLAFFKINVICGFAVLLMVLSGI